MSFFDKIKNRLSDKDNSDTADISDELTLDCRDSDDDFISGAFLNSLEQLTEDDIEMNETAAQKGKLSVSDVVRKIMIWFFLAMFIVSCIMLVDNLVDRQRSVEIYDQLQNEFFSSGFTFDAAAVFQPEEGEIKYLSADSSNSATPSMTDIIDTMNSGEVSEVVHKEYNEELEKMRAGLASLAQINPDLYGWISVEGTNINYPVVQGKDNDYYLDHAYTGDFLPNGSIFADYRNKSLVTDNRNTVMYGHNITSGTMFHDVTKFFEDEYFDNVYINVYTDDGIFVYEPFAVYKAKYDYNYFRTRFDTDEEFIAFCEEVRDNSEMKSKADMTFTADDRLLTLSTCTNILDSERYALHAKLVKIIVD